MRGRGLSWQRTNRPIDGSTEYNAEELSRILASPGSASQEALALALGLGVSRAELNIDATFPQPAFGLLRDMPKLLETLFGKLSLYGLRLQDLKPERSAETAADVNVACFLFNNRMIARVRLDKVEMYCSELTEESLPSYRAAVVDVLKAVQIHAPDVTFGLYTVALGLHGMLDGAPVREFLRRFVGNVPNGLGPVTGNGAVVYFGPDGDRLFSSVTMDLSAAVADALYFRSYAIWDGKKCQVTELPDRIAKFVRQALDAVGLDVASAAL